MAFKTSQMDQIALEYWYYGFLGRLRVDGRGFLHQTPILKNCSPDRNQVAARTQKRVTVPLIAQNAQHKLGGCVLEPRTQLLLSLLLLLLLLLLMMILIIGFTCPPTIHFKFIQSTTSVTLQSATAYFITKGDGLLSQSATAFFITKCDKCYYKGRELLQSATEQAF